MDTIHPSAYSLPACPTKPLPRASIPSSVPPRLSMLSESALMEPAHAITPRSLEDRGGMSRMYRSIGGSTILSTLESTSPLSRNWNEFAESSGSTFEFAFDD